MLKKILLFALISSVCGTTFDCKYQTSGWAYIGGLYSCISQPRQLTSNKTVEHFFGTHQTDKNDNDVKVVSFENCRDLKFIPQGIHKIFQNFIAIRFFNCKIEEVGSFDLSDYHELKWIVIYGSLITNIPGDFFINNSNLIYVNFNKNKIKNIGRGLFIGLDSLRQVTMNYNVFISGSGLDKNLSKFIEKLMNSCPEFIATTTVIESYTTSSSMVNTDLLLEGMKTDFLIYETTKIKDHTSESWSTNSAKKFSSSANEELTTRHPSTLSYSDHATETFTTDSLIQKEADFDKNTSIDTLMDTSSIPINKEHFASITPSPTAPCFLHSKNPSEILKTQPSTQSTTIATTSATTNKPQTNDDDICDIKKLNAKFENEIEKYLELSTRPCYS